MKPTKTERLDLSMRSSTGFSIVELMVVVVILGGLASLAMPRLRAFIAKSRQAEAKNMLTQIHTLQMSYQNFHDKFASWAQAPGTTVGKNGVCGSSIAPVSNTAGTCSDVTLTTETACTNATKIWTPAVAGAKELGFKPQNCEDLRYGYWVLRGVEPATGKEVYLALAYAPSDTDDRIYPTCTGKKANRPAMKHSSGSISDVAVPDGDWQTVNEDKVWGHSDIIPICE